jgi:hypothetical protein
MLAWIGKIFRRPSPEERIFYTTAEQVLDELANGENATASVQKAHPDIRKEHWKSVRTVLDAITAETDTRKRTLLIRSQLAKYVELVVTAHWYTNLSEGERDLVARFVLDSSRQTQDEHYYFSFANNFAVANVLDAFVTHGWEGSEASRQQIKLAKERFIEQCKEHCALLLKIAKAKNAGSDLTDSEQNSGKTTMTLKEGFRRMLAGEKVLDE